MTRPGRHDGGAELDRRGPLARERERGEGVLAPRHVGDPPRREPMRLGPARLRNDLLERRSRRARLRDEDPDAHEASPTHGLPAKQGTPGAYNAVAARERGPSRERRTTRWAD